MSDKRQKNQLTHGGHAVRDQQLVLAFMQEDRGEAPKDLTEGTESLVAKRRTESPAMGEQLMEDVCGGGKLQAGIGASQGQQREPWGGRDDRPAVARAPEPALASDPGTMAKRDV